MGDTTRTVLLHYGGYWGYLNSGSVTVSDYKGGKVKSVVYDVDELCFRDIKKDLVDLLKLKDVNLDNEDGFRISSIQDGLVYSIHSDKSLMTWWGLQKPDVRGLFHLFSAIQPPTYAPSERTLRSKTSPTIPFIPPRKLQCSSKPPNPPPIPINEDSNSAPEVQILTPSLNKECSNSSQIAAAISDWSTALDNISLSDYDFGISSCTAIRVVEDGSDVCEGGSNVCEDGSNVCEDGSNVYEDVSSGEDVRGLDDYDFGKKFGPIVNEAEEYYSDHDSEGSDGEFVPSDDEVDLNSSDDEEDEVLWMDKDDNEPIHDGEETETFLKMANDVYQDEADDEDEHVLDEADMELRVGMQWPTMRNCRSFFKKYAVKKKFMFAQVKNNKQSYKLKCKDPECEWWMLCSRQPDGFTVELRLLNNVHTCTADVDNKNIHANAPLVAQQLEEFVRTHPECTPKMVKNQMFSLTGVKVNYWVAWAARRRLLEKLNGNYEEGFKLVPDMARNILSNNEGSIIKWYKNENTNEFEGLFIAFKASLDGWLNGCRPVVGLDGCFFKGKYGGACLSAMGLDAMNGLFPLAIYITTGEHMDSWSILLGLLQNCFNNHSEKVTFICDRQKGLVDSVRVYYPTFHHRYCFRHMYQNFKRDGNTGDYLEQLSWGAARALKEPEHLDYMKPIQTASEKAYAWLTREPVKNWARHAFDKTCKCDKITNNFSESFNAWILKIRDKLIVQFVDNYMSALTALMYERRRLSRELDSDAVVPKVMYIIEKFQKTYHKFTVEGISDDTFMALSKHGKKYFVNIQRLTCTCTAWQLSGIPCIHAVAFLTPRREPWIKYCSPFYSVESFRNTYKGYIFPLENVEDWIKGDELVLPPFVSRQPGRPKTMRIRAEDEPLRKRQRDCKKCGSKGHNTRTCARRSAGSYSTKRVRTQRRPPKTTATPSTSTQASATAPPSTSTQASATAPPSTSAEATTSTVRRRGRPPKSTPTSTPANDTRKSKRTLTQPDSERGKAVKKSRASGVMSQE